jgi:hypothetical protein
MKLKNLFYLFFLALEGCLIVDASYHKTFIEQNNYLIGFSVEELHKYKHQSPLETIILKNYHIEEKWGWWRSWNKKEKIFTCFVFYEHDPKTKIVVNWRYEGSKETCVSVAP